jgi:hypothetical protein
MAIPVALARDERDALEALRLEALPLTGDHGDYDALLALVGDERTQAWEFGEPPETYPSAL